MPDLKRKINSPYMLPVDNETHWLLREAITELIRKRNSANKDSQPLGNLLHTMNVLFIGIEEKEGNLHNPNETAGT